MKAKALLGLLIVASLAGIGDLVLRIPAPIPPALPTPNAYDAFVAAADRMPELPLDLESTQDVNRLFACLESNSEALRELEKGLRQECQLPVESMIVASTRPRMFRKLLRLLVVRFRIAEMHARFDAAAGASFDTFTFAQQLKQSALVLDHLTAAAIEEVAVADLTRIASKVSAEKRKQIVAAIESGESKSATNQKIVEDILEREQQELVAEVGQLRAMVTNLTGNGAGELESDLVRILDQKRVARKQLILALKE